MHTAYAASRKLIWKLPTGHGLDRIVEDRVAGNHDPVSPDPVGRDVVARDVKDLQ